MVDTVEVMLAQDRLNLPNHDLVALLLTILAVLEGSKRRARPVSVLLTLVICVRNADLGSMDPNALATINAAYETFGFILETCQRL